MHDLLPEVSGLWREMEECLHQTLIQYGYRELRIPLLESSAVFSRSIGESSDIVAKEMYEFSDRNGDLLSLRPEGTAGVVRAAIEHGLLYKQTQRLWYSGPMFRHERPQRGRLRQFHQLGVESFGFEGAEMDAELLLLAARCWRRLGVEGLRLELNSLGSVEARKAYRAQLCAYFESHKEQLDADSQRRLGSNPLRILDSKNPALRELINAAPKLLDYLDAASERHFSRLCELLDAADVAYRINPHLVRGLDYYERTVFEWVSDSLGAQGAVCAGGRYDRLVGQMQGSDTPAAGFAIGLERLFSLCQDVGIGGADSAPHVYFVHADGDCATRAMRLCESLRDDLPAFRVVLHCGADSFRGQFRKADRSNAELAFVMGEDELRERCVTVKFLRSEDAQRQMKWDALASFLSAHCNW